MLSAVLNSDVAISVSVQIMDAFVEMRTHISSNSLFNYRIERLETKQLDTEKRFEQIFNELESKQLKHSQGIVRGHIFRTG